MQRSWNRAPRRLAKPQTVEDDAVKTVLTYKTIVKYIKIWKGGRVV